MTFIRTLVMALVAVGLGAYIYLVEAPRLADESAPDTLYVFDPEDVTGVELSYRNGHEIALSKESGEWRMTKPVEFPADKKVVKDLIGAVANVEVERRLSASESLDLETYGLKDHGEQARVVVEVAGEKLPAVDVGRTTPVGFSAFVKLADSDEVLVTPLLFHGGVRKTAFELRKKQLLEVAPASIVAVLITNGDRTIEAVREGVQWHLRAPVEDYGDQEAIDELLKFMNGIHAIQYIDGDAPASLDTGLKEPILRVEMRAASGATIGFSLGNRDETVPAGYFFERHEDRQLAKVADSILRRFTMSPHALRDKRVIRCDPDQLTSLTVTRQGQQPFTFQREDTEEGTPWTTTASTNRAVNQQSVARVVRGLDKMKADSIVVDTQSEAELAQYNLDAPELDLLVTEADGRNCRVQASQATNDDEESSATYNLRRGNEATILSAAAHSYSRIDLHLEDLLEVEPPSAGE